MSTNELNTIARDLKQLRLMAEQLDAEIKTLEDPRYLSAALSGVCERKAQRQRAGEGVRAEQADGVQVFAASLITRMA